MSVVVICRMQAEPAALVELFRTQKDVFERVAAEGKRRGAVRHQFLLGEGEVLVLDEWDTAESFLAFFNDNEDIPKLMAQAGVQGPPEISFFATTDSPDKF